MSTVLMIDISHSMICTVKIELHQQKKLLWLWQNSSLHATLKTLLDILVFGNDASQILLKDLPYLEVGPYHTNTVAGLNWHGFTPKKEKYEQTNFYDHRRQTQLS